MYVKPRHDIFTLRCDFYVRYMCVYTWTHRTKNNIPPNWKDMSYI